eukprot:5779773-Amphidinium_carterae.1
MTASLESTHGPMPSQPSFVGSTVFVTTCTLCVTKRILQRRPQRILLRAQRSRPSSLSRCVALRQARLPQVCSQRRLVPVRTTLFPNLKFVIIFAQAFAQSALYISGFDC